MPVVAEPTVTIRLEAGCDYETCAEFAFPLHNQLAGGGYDWPCSVLPLPATFADYMSLIRTGRKRAWRSARLGYRFAEIDRAQHADAIHAINTSKPERQGRPMSASYQTRQTYSPLPDYPCPRHSISTYGVLVEQMLVAYAVVYRSGDLVMISQILGHADHLENDIMYLLVTEAIRVQIERGGPGVAFYNMWNSGTDGLRYFKARLGFRPARVEWSLT